MPRRIAAFIICMTATCCVWAGETKEAGSSDNLKAVFIYHFTKYFEWPDDEAETFDITVLGKSGIVKPLREIAVKRQVRGKKIKVSEVEKVDEIERCRILFISKPAEKWLKEIMAKAEDWKTLTVGSSDGLAKKGVAVNFITIKKKMKFEINTDAVKRIDLKPSSQLLKLAKVVEDEDPSE